MTVEELIDRLEDCYPTAEVLLAEADGLPPFEPIARATLIDQGRAVVLVEDISETRP